LGVFFPKSYFYQNFILFFSPASEVHHILDPDNTSQGIHIMELPTAFTVDLC